MKGEWRVDPTALNGDFEGRTALLSPFDRLIHDRVRSEELFDFEYTLEMYKPAAKRRWGYFALPILHGDQLVGKLDAAADRRAGVFRVAAIHEDTPFPSEVTDAVHREIRELADWLALEVTGLPCTATDMAGRRTGETEQPKAIYDESNLMRLLEETHDWGSQ